MVKTLKMQEIRLQPYWLFSSDLFACKLVRFIYLLANLLNLFAYKFLQLFSYLKHLKCDICGTCRSKVLHCYQCSILSCRFQIWYYTCTSRTCHHRDSLKVKPAPTTSQWSKSGNDIKVLKISAHKQVSALLSRAVTMLSALLESIASKKTVLFCSKWKVYYKNTTFKLYFRRIEMSTASSILFNWFALVDYLFYLFSNCRMWHNTSCQWTCHNSATDIVFAADLNRSTHMIQRQGHLPMDTSLKYIQAITLMLSNIY